MREEIIGDARLILGDCREILPTLSGVDAVICDPPFGIGFDKYESHKDSVEEYADLMRAVVSECDRLRGDGPAFFWQGMLNADRWHEWFPRGFRLFAAAKGFVQYRPIGIQYSWDPVVFWGKPKGEPRADVKDFHFQALAPFGAGRPRIDHPCPRPLEQVEYVIDCATRRGDLVLDPFMGSGTTGVAAIRLGRRFIGVEIEPKYFDIARRRIEEATKQGDLIRDVLPKAKQEALGL